MRAYDIGDRVKTTHGFIGTISDIFTHQGVIHYQVTIIREYDSNISVLKENEISLVTDSK